MQLIRRHIEGRIKGHVAELRSRLARARYFRGHGVHSPYVYAIVREVFMRRDLMPGDRMLYRALLCEGVAPRRAVQLQNLAIHCRYGSFGLNCVQGELCVLTAAITPSQTVDLVRQAAGSGCDVAVLSPYRSAERQQVCRQLIADHASTTVDNRAYLLIFNNHLPKQHYRI